MSGTNTNQTRSPWQSRRNNKILLAGATMIALAIAGGLAAPEKRPTVTVTPPTIDVPPRVTAFADETDSGNSATKIPDGSVIFASTRNAQGELLVDACVDNWAAKDTTIDVFLVDDRGQDVWKDAGKWHLAAAAGEQNCVLEPVNLGKVPTAIIGMNVTRNNTQGHAEEVRGSGWNAEIVDSYRSQNPLFLQAPLFRFVPGLTDRIAEDCALPHIPNTMVNIQFGDHGTMINGLNARNVAMREIYKTCSTKTPPRQTHQQK
ncbi:MAG: hypothetical protein HOQ05_10255 [Corynebacteriales bacterium]|nr:hypothetical protein [Mycobacteriales bacterium]